MAYIVFTQDNIPVGRVSDKLIRQACNVGKLKYHGGYYTVSKGFAVEMMGSALFVQAGFILKERDE